ncbi:uncharacterized protein TNCV_301001 [Trichonephila clavipes]|nr:uncharacterized protein TNCV_301001 [Trichonephila clavipes]
MEVNHYGVGGTLWSWWYYGLVGRDVGRMHRAALITLIVLRYSDKILEPYLRDSWCVHIWRQQKIYYHLQQHGSEPLWSWWYYGLVGRDVGRMHRAALITLIVLRYSDKILEPYLRDSWCVHIWRQQKIYYHLQQHGSEPLWSWLYYGLVGRDVGRMHRAALITLIVLRYSDKILEPYLRDSWCVHIWRQQKIYYHLQQHGSEPLWSWLYYGLVGRDVGRMHRAALITLIVLRYSDKILEPYDGNMKLRAGSQRPPITSSREDRHIIHMTLVDRAAPSLSLWHQDGRTRVRWHCGERTLAACIRHCHTSPSPGMMVLGAIGYTARSHFVHIEGILISAHYISSVLRPMTLPFIRVLRNPTFKQGNARIHAAGIVWTFLDTENVRLLSWSARSLDLSPIEKVWSIVDERLAHHHTQVITVNELWYRVEAA